MKESKPVISQNHFRFLVREFTDLLDEIDAILPHDKKVRFERRAKATLQNLGSSTIFALARDAKECSNDEWDDINRIVKRRLNRAEIAERRKELESTAIPEEFGSTVRWMAERGAREELQLLQKIQADRSHQFEEYDELIVLAIGRISKRIQIERAPEDHVEIPQIGKIQRSRGDEPSIMSLISQLEWLSKNLETVKAELKDLWASFAAAINNASAMVVSGDPESSLLILRTSIEQLQSFSFFNDLIRSANDEGGLYSGHRQTPFRSTESLVRKHIIRDRLNPSSLHKVLKDLNNEINDLKTSTPAQ